ncbi:MAG: class I SAM-dependent methyltransferase [Chloroflexi bacterium]|nr:class I SAM-dependent methyltransferase [Chloroflexota bacterium]
MPDPLDDLHARFTQQARWTADIRARLLALPPARAAGAVLEVGSGTGAITLDLHGRTPARIVGLDRDHASNAYATRHDPATRFATGFGERLPFGPGAFDVSFCHFLLLWVRDPQAILSEMVRVTVPGGAVLCLAEPDYGGRIEYPDSLAALGLAQESALRRKGADTRLGRRLRHLLVQAGLVSVEVGVLGGEWRLGAAPSAREADLEWKTLSDDLAGDMPPQALEDLRRTLTAARDEGRHLLFIPTFYGWGLCPR